MNKLVGVIGASGFTGGAVLDAVAVTGAAAVPYSRSARGEGWHVLGESTLGQPPVAHWVLACGVTFFAEHADLLLARGARRVVAVSSTSIFTKTKTASDTEHRIMADLRAAEEGFARWAEQHGIEWIIIRPTLIYGYGRDRNVAEIARLIRRFGFFPMFGAARGKRQPIHVADLAQCCVSALERGTPNRAYNVAGAEVLDYREMVRRIFAANKKPAIMPTVPLGLFRLALAAANKIPRFSHWTAEMAERMNIDMVFDYADATEAFGFHPRPFTPEQGSA